MPTTSPLLEWAIQLTPSVTASSVTDADPLVLPFGLVRAPDAELTVVDLEAPLRDTLPDYARRDAELGHRDLVAGVLAAKLLYAVSQAWGVNVQQLVLPFQPVSDTPVYSDSDTAYNAFARLTHLTGEDVVASAIRVDKECYNRDHLIYKAVAEIAVTLDSAVRPTDYSYGGAPSLYWSPAQGLVSTHTVSFRGWGQELFNDPDRNLTERDNIIGRAVAVAGRIIREGYRHVTRVSAAIWENGIKTHEHETYVKVSEDDRYVDFAAFPRISGANLLRYDKLGNRIQFVHAGGPTFGTGPFIPVGSDGSWLDVTGTLPVAPTSQRVAVAAGSAQVRDSAYWAQKAGQVNFSPNTEEPALSFTAANASGPAVLSRRNKSVSFVIPDGTPVGAYAVYVDVTPSGPRLAPLVPLIIGTALSTSCAEIAAYPGRRDVVAAAYIRSSTDEERLYVSISYPNTDADYATVAAVGTAARSAGASFTLNPYGIKELWQHRAWRDGFYGREIVTFSQSTQLRINAVELRLRDTAAVTPNAAGLQGVKAECLSRALASVRAAYAEAILDPVVEPVFEVLNVTVGKAIPPYQITAHNAHAANFVVNLSATLRVTGFGELDDYEVGAELILWPNLVAQTPAVVEIVAVTNTGGMLEVTADRALSYSGGGTLVPRKRSFRFAVANAPVGIACNETTGVVSGAVNFSTFTGSLECEALVATPDALVSSTPVALAVTAAPAKSPYAWTSAGIENWTEAMVNGREPRLRSAFRLGTAGDVGRPALVPDGLRLEADGTVSSAYRTRSSVPVLTCFEPWMIGAGVYVCVDSFWSPPQNRRKIG